MKSIKITNSTWKNTHGLALLTNKFIIPGKIDGEHIFHVLSKNDNY